MATSKPKAAPKPAPKAQHVTKRPDDKWQHKAVGNTKATKVTDTQKQAAASAIKVAKNQKSEVVIHGVDGKIKSKDSYGRDPNPPKDKEH